MQIYVEVEDNDNTYGVPLRAFSTLADAYLVSHVKMDTRAGIGIRHRVTGWSSEGGGSPCPAYCVPVEDSGMPSPTSSMGATGGYGSGHCSPMPVGTWPTGTSSASPTSYSPPSPT